MNGCVIRSLRRELLSCHIRLPIALGYGLVLGSGVAPLCSAGVYSSSNPLSQEEITVDLKFADPDDSNWADLPEGKVILSDKLTKIKIVIKPKQTDMAAVFQAIGTDLKISTSGTAPNGRSYALSAGNAGLVQMSDSSEIRVAIGRAELRAIGALPQLEHDGVIEKAWFDVGDSNPNQSSNLTDGQYFGTFMSGESRGQSTKYGNLESGPANSPIDKTFVKAAGVEIIRCSYGGATSPRRQIMNQADTFYYSGHGFHIDGSIKMGGYNMLPSEIGSYWHDELVLAIFFCCSILDINDYNNNAQDGKSPGKLWANLGPQILLGYNWSAPGDDQGSATILANWMSNLCTKDEVCAWREANDNSAGHNACAIVANSSYCYFKKTTILGAWFWTWTTVPVSQW